MINFLEFFVCNSFINVSERKGLLIHIVKTVLISSLETFIDIGDGLNFD